MTAPASRGDARWQVALAGALMAGGPLWHYLYVNRYPLRAELVLLPAGAALLGAGVLLLAWRGPPAVRAAVFAGLLALWIDLQLNVETLRWSWLVLALVLGAAFLMRRRALVTMLALSAFYLSSLPRPAAVVRGPETARAAEPPPLLLHLVLDGQVGIGGLRAAGDSATADFLAAFYRRWGFAVYEGAYSRSSSTRRSLGRAMALGGPAQIRGIGPDAWRLTANPYFALLRSRGYSLRVFQTSHLDTCHAPEAPVSYCATASANSIANVGYLDADLADRAVLAGRFFLNMSSQLYRKLQARRDGTRWRRTYAGRGVAFAAEVRADIAAHGARGQAWFVHLMLPHSPFEVDASCHAYQRLAQRLDQPNFNAHVDSTWPIRAAQYRDQVHCAHQLAEAILAAVDSAVGRDNAIVVVHGDHGARMDSLRIPWHSLHRYSVRQLTTFFSTLLAVRVPGQPARVDSTAVPLQDYFWELARSGFTAPPGGDWRHFVISFPEDGLPGDTMTIRYLAAAQMPWGAVRR